MMLLLTAVLVLVSLLQLVFDPEAASAQLLEVGVPLAISTPTVYVAIEIRDSGNPDSFQLYSLSLSILFAAIAFCTVGLVLWSQAYQGAAIVDPLFPIAISLAAGSGVGSVSGMMLYDLNVTRQELADEVHRTRLLNQRLKVVNRVLRHNVRNSLSVAYVALDHIEDEVTAGKLRELVGKCKSALDELRSRADKSLQIQRLDDERVTVELVGVIERAVSELANTDGTQIDRRVPDRVTITGHPMVKVAVKEAIENALEHNHAPDSKVRIDVSEESGCVALSIHDNGPGISDRELGHLELDEETPLQHSSGVGLWLIKWIVESSGGRLEFGESDLGGQAVVMKFRRTAQP
jgi:signal transduction histidine kinase